jgi:branched-chain amino acid transport system permease protein
MSEPPETDRLPERPDAGVDPDLRIGVDEWVTRHGELRVQRLHQKLDGLPWYAWLGGFVLVVAFLPLMTSNEYVVRVGVETLVFALLAMGLNVVVGWSGLLDLGYVAFWGFGAYFYALLSSAHYNIHWPAEASVPVIVTGAAIFGFLLGLPSRRLVGDYLAIVTLFFLEAFVVFTNNGSAISFLGFTGKTDLTGGPNGIPGLDPFHLFGIRVNSTSGYFYLILCVFVFVTIVLAFLSHSRTGNAWKALREDPLAAELMGVPVNRLKLLAFVVGAAIAGLTGSVYGAFEGGVFSGNFDIPLLITVYAMLVLGGAGSIAGAVIGAIVVNASLEVLRNGNQSRWLFYAIVVLTLAAKVRPWRYFAALLAVVTGFGFALHAIVAAVWPSGTRGTAIGGDFVARAAQYWVIHPLHDSELIGKYGFVFLVLALALLTTVRGLWRLPALVPVLYLAAFVWENLLATNPPATRFLMLGTILIVLMTARPQGLLGTTRVEIV